MMNLLLISLMFQFLPERIVVPQGDSVRLNINQRRIKHIQVLPPTIGTFEHGYFYGRKIGDGIIKVVFKDRPPAYTYVKVVGRKRWFEVKVSPLKVVLNPGDTIRFSLKSSVDKGCFVKWKVIPSWIGEISFTGEFVAGRKLGKGKVVAIVKCGQKRGAGFASVSIGDPLRFTAVKIFPDPVYIDRHKKLKIKVTPDAFDSVSWIVEPERLGFVNENQEFVPLKDHGRGVIWFTGWKNDSIYTGKALVFVGRPPGPILITKSVLAPGETCRVVARPPGRMRRRLKKARFQWNVEPEWLGQFLDREDFPETRFVAGDTPGLGIISLKINGRTLKFTQTPVIVGKTKVNIIPSSRYMRIGETVGFRIDKNVKGVWRVFPEFAGKIDEKGNFTAEVPLREAFVIFEIKEPGGGGGISRITILPEMAD